MKLSSISVRKISYWFLPPVMYKVFNSFHLKIFGQSQLNGDRFQGLNLLDKLRSNKFSHFFDERVIEDFCDAMERDNKMNQPRKTRESGNQKYLDELVENGICVIRGLFDESTVSQEHDALASTLEPVKERAAELVKEHGKDSGLNISETHFGLRIDFELMSKIIRIWHIEKVQSNLKLFKENASIYDVCSSYFGGSIGPSGIYAEYKYDTKSYDPNFQLHSDSPFRQLKVFILLNDITEKNAPLVYYKKTQKVEDWRIMKDLIDFTNYNKKYNFSFGFAKLAMTKLSKKFPDLCGPEMLVTGKAGDVIICETRGVHGGSPLLEGHRLQLGMVFQALGTIDIGNIPNKVKSLTANSIETN